MVAVPWDPLIPYLNFKGMVIEPEGLPDKYLVPSCSFDDRGRENGRSPLHFVRVSSEVLGIQQKKRGAIK